MFPRAAAAKHPAAVRSFRSRFRHPVRFFMFSASVSGMDGGFPARETSHWHLFTNKDQKMLIFVVFVKVLSRAVW